MKVIFLDIDGVLNCKKTPNPRKLPYVVDKKLLARFQALVKRTKAKVVLSSTWRVDPIGLLAAKYWHVPFVDCCPDMPRSSRSKEIRKWLAQHPKVTRYVVIDDEDDELDDLPLFQPSSAMGLSVKMARQVEAYLMGKTGEPRGPAELFESLKTLNPSSLAIRARGSGQTRRSAGGGGNSQLFQLYWGTGCGAVRAMASALEGCNRAICGWSRHPFLACRGLPDRFQARVFSDAPSRACYGKSSEPLHCVRCGEVQERQKLMFPLRAIALSYGALRVG